MQSIVNLDHNAGCGPPAMIPSKYLDQEDIERRTIILEHPVKCFVSPKVGSELQIICTYASNFKLEIRYYS
jgi:hypothetical protein